MNELWKGFACLLKSEKALNLSAESVSVDFNEGKAEKNWLESMRSQWNKNTKLWVCDQISQILF